MESDKPKPSIDVLLRTHAHVELDYAQPVAKRIEHPGQPAQYELVVVDERDALESRHL